MFFYREDDGGLTVHFNVHMGPEAADVRPEDVDNVLRAEIEAANARADLNATANFSPEAAASGGPAVTPEERTVAVVAGSVLSGLIIDENTLEIHGKLQ
jgi:hypothetical protein